MGVYVIAAGSGTEPSDTWYALALVNPKIAGPVLGDRTDFRPSSFLKRSNPGIHVAEFAQDGISSSHISSSLDSETLSLIALLTS